ncbi:MAG: helix-turn-helix domain-containing protein [Aggregatilineales bacterium]
MELRAASIINSEIEGHYAFFPFIEGISTREHQHDFYEIFLIAEGSIEHHINGATDILKNGSLVFIRPKDAHFFRQYAGDNCKLINLAFLVRTFDVITTFLDFQADILLCSPQPPAQVLSHSDTLSLQNRLQYWGRMLYGEKPRSRQTLRALLAHIISHYFISQQEPLAEMPPLWLTDLIRAMQESDNFIEGREALMRLANRTPEYIGRTFKKHLGLTPSQFINNLRLDYAGNLLLNTDRSPTDIAYDVGFGNLSYFYHLFKVRWHCSPNQYRNQHQQTLLP